MRELSKHSLRQGVEYREEKDRGAILSQIFERSGLKKLALIALAFLITEGSGNNVKTVELPIKANHVLVELTINKNSERGSYLSFTSWPDFKVASSSHKIALDENIKRITKPVALIEEMGLSADKIADKETFKKWVLNQAEYPNVKKIISNMGENDPKRFIALAEAIVIVNLEYSYNIEDKTKTLNHSIDEILEKSLPAECEHYAIATQAVFNVLKDAHEKELRNVYVSTNEGKNLAHVWNVVMDVRDPHHAAITFVDPTAADPSWKNNLTLDSLSVQDLEYTLQEKGILQKQGHNL